MSRSTAWRSSLTVAVTALVCIPASVWASHQFSDVDTTHPFHSEISALAGAGITGGFADGTFRPGNTVTRQAMAAFFERGGSRTHRGSGGTALNGGDTVEVARATVEAGAAGSGNGFVKLLGNVWAHTSGSTNVALCPCILELRLLAGSNLVAANHYMQVPGTAGADGIALASGLIQAVVPLPADRLQTFRLLVHGFDTDARSINVNGDLTATYVPFSGDGDATLEQTRACPRDDGFEDNDTSASPTTLLLSSVPGFSVNTVPAIVCPGDEDWLGPTKTLAAGDQVRVDAIFSHAEGNIDVCLWRQPSTVVTCATTTTNSETIIVTAPESGVYTARVYLESDAGAVVGNPYSLNFRHTPATPVAPDDGGAEIRLPDGRDEE